jgi:hypothetical protein
MKTSKFFISMVAVLSLSSVNLIASASSEHSKSEQDKDGCQFDIESDLRIERFRGKTHSSLCRTVKNIDSWFGNKKQFDDSQFGGKLVFGFRQDEENGFNPKLRVHINAKLPNLSERTNAFIGKTDEEAFVTDNNISSEDELDNYVRDEESTWLVGLGYSNPSRHGFSISAGGKIRSGFKPYIKTRHRHFFNPSEKTLLKLTQTGFWRKEVGLGFTSNAQLSYFISDNHLLSWETGATYKKDTEVWETGTSLTLYQKLDAKRGLSYKAYIYGQSGERKAVNVPEYGIGIGYHQPFFKPWLTLKTSLENRWFHSSNADPKESYAKFTTLIEMKFGKYKK